jgi:diaminohydroxyphosphoribosylaminopyrimidine deaminase / 5-amino-6-(5-phosphoribosylamino)uracil reductase
MGSDFDESMMSICFALAIKGMTRVEPNPMVGSVLVHDGNIIGMGFHEYYGGPHAEVNAIQQVKPEDESLIPFSTLYVSLEPCNIYKNTPPCTQFIISENIKKVVVSCLDSNPEISGKGIAELNLNGIETIVGVLESEGKMLTRFRDVFFQRKRPYIFLKYALSKDNFFCPTDRTTFWFSNIESKMQVHKWRSESHALLIGSGTLLSDDPLLNVRLVEGRSPKVVVLAPQTTLPSYLKIFTTGAEIYIFSSVLQVVEGKHIHIIDTSSQTDYIGFVLDELFKRRMFIVMVEGGHATIDNLVKSNLWDEARIIFTPTYLDKGLKGFVPKVEPYDRFELKEDQILLYLNK